MEGVGSDEWDRYALNGEEGMVAREINKSKLLYHFNLSFDVDA